MKNWLRYPTGEWTLDVDAGDRVWRETGTAWVDPAAVTAVVEYDTPGKVTVIFLGARLIGTQEKSGPDIIADLQSALSN